MEIIKIFQAISTVASLIQIVDDHASMLCLDNCDFALRIHNHYYFIIRADKFLLSRKYYESWKFHSDMKPAKIR